MTTVRRSIGIAIASIVAAVAASGCGGGAVPAQTPASGDPAGPWITITAGEIAFDQAEVSIAANQPFTIAFESRDAMPHNVSIFVGDTGERRFEGAVFTGPATRWYAVPALAPGTYRFVCDVHPNGMTGRLIAT